MTQSYSLREVEKLLGLSRSTLTGLIDAGFVKPARGARREYRFTFHDLVVLRAARGLSEAKLPPARIMRSLRKLRSELPDEMPLSGLRIEAIGSSVVVSDGRSQWQPDDGQYVLRFNVESPEGAIRFVEKPVAAAASSSAPAVSADGWFDRAQSLEDSDVVAAMDAYRRAIEADPMHASAHANLGRLLHLDHKLADADAVYTRGLAACGPEPTLLFNHATLLEDMGRSDEAFQRYRECIARAPAFADAHYNLALLCEARGLHQDAIRHLSEFRRLR